MQRVGYIPRPTWRYVALRGAAVSVGLTFAYALAFLLYAIVRSSLTLAARVNPDTGLLGTLIATWTSLAIAVLTMASLMAVVAAVLGTATALIVLWLSSVLNPRRVSARAIMIGLVTCLGIALLLNLALQQALSLSWSALVSEAYLFWLGLPSLIYVGAGGVASWQLAGPR
jgi:hypothetical protein